MLPVTSLWLPRSSVHSVFSVHRHSPQHNWQHTNKKFHSEIQPWSGSTRLNSPREAPARKVRMRLSLVRVQSVSALPPSTFPWRASEMRACAFSWCVCLPLSRHAAPLLLQYACSRVPAPITAPISFSLLLTCWLPALPPCLGWNISPANAKMGRSISGMTLVCVWPGVHRSSNAW